MENTRLKQKTSSLETKIREANEEIKNIRKSKTMNYDKIAALNADIHNHRKTINSLKRRLYN
jgi:predicted  nucleic acid-binding Zn-ribbon protein